MDVFRVRELAISWLERTLVLGVFIVLAGLVLLPSSSRYHTFYYLLVLAPVVVMLAIKPKVVVQSLSPVFSCFLLFALWTTVSILWSDTAENILHPLKRSLYIFCLFLSFAIVVKQPNEIFLKVCVVAGSLIAAISLYHFIKFVGEYRSGERFIGGGALRNPLLSSHVFGFFTVFFTALLFLGKEWSVRIIYSLLALTLFVFIVATGSRTPLVALAAAFLWIAFMLCNKQSLIILAALFLALISVYLFYPEAILSRGVSYRPELWGLAIDKMLERPFLGYGFDAHTAFVHSGHNTVYREAHNMHLSVWYFVGVIGFILWCFMHAYALWFCWKKKDKSMYLIGGALLVYGAMAGMFEGGGLLPKAKEHWFITWIPLAFISALLASDKIRQRDLVGSLSTRR